jgi:hypothetical protein
VNGLYQAAAEVQDFCNERGWRFCFIGPLALIRWGAVRQTRNVDLTLLTQFEDERFVDELLSNFQARWDNARDFALRNRVVLVMAANNVPVDISLGGLPFEEALIRRASPFEYLPGLNLVTASAADLVVLKCFAGRTQDWADVEGILARQRGLWDWSLILRELRFLCELKESPDTVDRLLQLRDQLAAE